MHHDYWSGPQACHKTVKLCVTAFVAVRLAGAWAEEKRVNWQKRQRQRRSAKPDEGPDKAKVGQGQIKDKPR